MEDDGEDCTWQLVVHLHTDITLVIQVSSGQVCVCSGVCDCVYLQPVQLGSQAALVQRLFVLHLDPRQEVPPHLAGEWLTHHHSGSAEVDLVTSHTHSQFIGQKQCG